ncbi:MAG: glycosyltransferase [Bacteroidales bacterium]|nr:glycosyltransferase [Bacteroidales bacterium]
MQTTIIIPCYNESGRLKRQVFLDYVQKNPEIHFLFVNDGSKDDTLSVLQQMALQQGNIGYLNLETNVGKAEAVRQGMLHAAQENTAEYIGFWDADLATPLWEIPHFTELISKKGFDIVTGLRLARLGAHIKRKNVRHYLGRCFATTVSMVLHVPVYDTQCGAKLFKSDKVTLLFEQPFITKWLFDVELLARYIKFFGISHAKDNIYEYPLWSWEDVDGSQVKAKDFLKGPYELWKIKKAYK